MSINSFTFDGVSSEDMGLYVGGQKTFGAPQRDVTKVSIPGRNGDLVRDNGRFLNSEIAYNIVAMNDFKEIAQNVRNWLMSAKGYKRLEDTYHPEHYRMACVSGGIDFETGAYNATGKAQILFDCMPQRFLKSGEETSDASMVNRTESGDLFSFETVAESPITSASVSLSPIQSLNGYDSPWPAGGGVNKCAFPSVDFTLNGVRYYTENGTLHMSGTSSGETSSTNSAFEALHFKLPAGTYYFSRFTFRAPTYLYKVGESTALVTNNGSFTLSEETDLRVGFYVYNKTFSGETIPLSVTAGSSAPSAYTPTANICPISGHTGAELYRTGKNLLPHKFYQFNSSQLNVGTDTSTTYVHYLKAGTYTLSASLMGQARWLIREEHDTANTNVGGTLISANPHGTFTIDKDGMYRIWLYGSGITAEMVTWFQLELGSSATTYEPYQGDTYSVTFTDQGTVYGGTYDFVSGKLTVTHKTLTVDGTQALTWNSGAGVVQVLSTGFAATDDITQFYSDRFMAHAISGVADMNNEFTVNSAGILMIKAPALFTSLGEASTYFVNNPTQFVGLMSAPIEYTLSPQQLTTLLGANSVFGSGTITLTYVEPGVIENPTPFEAKPIIRVYGSGTCTVTINNQIITINNVTDFVDIDCETMNCYNGVVNKNADVVLGAQGFPVLPAGKTMIKTGGGTTKIEITPRWWEV